MTILKTERLILRSVNHDDIKDLYEIWKTDFVQKYNVMKVVPFSEYQEAMEKELSLDNLCIVLKETDTVIGHVTLSDDSIRYRVNSIMISYWLKQEHSHQGYMSEALVTLLDYLFYTKKYDLVTARVFSDNKASLSLLLKLGFQQEGYLRHAIKNHKGKIFDDVLFVKFK